MNEVVSQFEYASGAISRFSNPNHAGSLNSQTDTASAQAGSRDRGASVRFWVQMHNGRIVKMRFQAYGCPHFIAAAQMLCEWAVGQSALELLQWHWQLVQGDLEIPAAKRGKLLLLEDAVRAVAAEIDALC